MQTASATTEQAHTTTAALHVATDGSALLLWGESLQRPRYTRGHATGRAHPFAAGHLQLRVALEQLDVTSTGVAEFVALSIPTSNGMPLVSPTAVDNGAVAAERVGPAKRKSWTVPVLRLGPAAATNLLVAGWGSLWFGPVVDTVVDLTLDVCRRRLTSCAAGRVLDGAWGVVDGDQVTLWRQLAVRQISGGDETSPRDGDGHDVREGRRVGVPTGAVTVQRHS